jgi:iron complex outermembrane receptor protein
VRAEDPPSNTQNEASSSAENDSVEDTEIDMDGGFVYETVVTSYHIRPTDQVTGFAETIDVSDEVKATRSVSEILSDSVGVQVRATGGLGSYGAASIRGSTAGQVPIFLDGVLLNVGGLSSVNLGQLSLDVIETIEIYRGNVPVALGTAGIGGAIALKTRSFTEPVSEVAAGYGSWNTWRLFALHGNLIGPVSALVILSAQGSEGDFRYFNHNGTLRDPSDDKIQTRENNQHKAYGGLVKVGARIRTWEWTLLNDLFVKKQNIAGMGNTPARDANLSLLRDTLNLRFSGPVSPHVKLRLDANYLTLQQDYQDVQAEISMIAERTKSSTNVVGGSAVMETEFTPKHRSCFRVASHYEQFRLLELVRDNQSKSHRVRTELALEHNWSPVENLAIVPAFRMEFLNSRFEPLPDREVAGDDAQQTAFNFLWSPTLGVRYEVIPGLILRANGGRYARPPSLVELFSSHGAIQSNPDLNPEIGINADAGITYILPGKGPLDFLRIDAAWFGSWVDDLIVYVQTSQNTVRPQNLDSAEIHGLESDLSISMWKIVALKANYTYLHGINKSDKPYHNGKRIPGRPVHQAYGKIQVGHIFSRVGAQVWFDVNYTDTIYLHPANLTEDIPSLTMLGLGGRIELVRERLTLTLEARNLLDTLTVVDSDGLKNMVRNFDGFPLPGRTILATIHWKI